MEKIRIQLEIFYRKIKIYKKIFECTPFEKSHLKSTNFYKEVHSQKYLSTPFYQKTHLIKVCESRPLKIKREQKLLRMNLS